MSRMVVVDNFYSCAFPGFFPLLLFLDVFSSVQQPMCINCPAMNFDLDRPCILAVAQHLRRGQSSVCGRLTSDLDFER